MWLEGLLSEDGGSHFPPPAPAQTTRVLMYSHDTFGLGHLRRSLVIAQELTRRHPAVEVTILTGAPRVASFPACDRVRLVRLPPVKKEASGAYVSGDEKMSLADAINARQAIITAEAIQLAPHVTIVDKEPTGLHEELLPALRHLRGSGSRIVLGLRDVLDAPESLRVEWARKQASRWIERFYDELWIYGPSDFHDPLAGLDLPGPLRDRAQFTGFLERSISYDLRSPEIAADYVLVTAGGGADGYPLLSRTIEALITLDGLQAVVVAGPYIALAELADLQTRARGRQGLKVIAFDPCMQNLVARSRALISMCGYNTFCEALSFDIPALYLPRTSPRREQWIRASRSEALGWSELFPLDDADDRNRFAAAIERLLSRAPPSSSRTRPDMGGLATIGSLVAPLLPRAARLASGPSRTQP